MQLCLRLINLLLNYRKANIYIMVKHFFTLKIYEKSDKLMKCPIYPNWNTKKNGECKRYWCWERLHGECPLRAKW
jgi:hypothetical protein